MDGYELDIVDLGDETDTFGSWELFIKDDSSDEEPGEPGEPEESGEATKPL
jgi:hypothetical protein